MISKVHPLLHPRSTPLIQAILYSTALFIAGLTISSLTGCQLDPGDEDVALGGDDGRVDEERTLDNDLLSWGTRATLEAEGAVMNVWGTAWSAGWSRDQV